MENQEVNLKKICRTCQSDSSDMELIFQNGENYDENRRIDEMLMECTAIQVNKYFNRRDTCLFRFFCAALNK